MNNGKITVGIEIFAQKSQTPLSKMMEQGTAPWQKPWKSGSPAPFEMPFNPTTARRYQGGNALYLMAVGSAKGYDDPRWMTYKQAAEQGCRSATAKSLTRGVLAIPELRLKFPGPRGLINQQKPQLAIAGRFIRAHSSCICSLQRRTDRWIPKRVQPVHQEWVSIQVGERILENSGAVIRHDRNDLPFYDIKNGYHSPAGCGNVRKTQQDTMERLCMNCRTGRGTDRGSIAKHSQIQLTLEVLPMPVRN